MQHGPQRRLFADRAVRVAALSAGAGVLLVAVLALRTLNSKPAEATPTSAALSELGPGFESATAQPSASIEQAQPSDSPLGAAADSDQPTSPGEPIAAAEPSAVASGAASADAPTTPKAKAKAKKPRPAARAAKRSGSAATTKKPSLKNPFE